MTRLTRLLVAVFSTWLASVAGAQIGTVVGQQKISATTGGFAGPLTDGDAFGSALAGLGDLDGDGVEDLAVGTPADDDGGPRTGAVWILFLDPAGSVRSSTKISNLGGFPDTLVPNGRFGSSLAALGDMDGNGIPDLAVGAPGAQTVWLCSLRANGTVRAAGKTTAQDSLYVPAILPQERFGSALTSLGDLDGNGVVDLAVGCPGDSILPAAGSAVWFLYLTPFGSISRAQQVASSIGGTGPLAGRLFASQLAAADVDGDLDLDLVTPGTFTSPMFPDFGLLRLILDAGHNFVRADEVAAAELETYMGLSQDAEDLGGLCFLGDMDGDGGLELAYGAPNWRSDPARLRRGALFIASTRALGPARRYRLVSSNRGGLEGLLPGDGFFGASCATIGDLDGDGTTELAVGAPRDSASGAHRGAVWILSLDDSPLRNGSGVNPLTLSEVAPPVMVQPWNLDLDCSAHASGLSLLAGYARLQAGAPSVAGEVLVDPTSPQLFRILQPHLGGVSRYTLVIPANLSLISLPLHLQGMCAGLPGPRLSNALDEILSVP